MIKMLVFFFFYYIVHQKFLPNEQKAYKKICQGIRLKDVLRENFDLTEHYTSIMSYPPYFLVLDQADILLWC